MSKNTEQPTIIATTIAAAICIVGIVAIVFSTQHPSSSGKYGGTYDNSSMPTLEIAKQVCSEAENVFKEESLTDFSDDQEYNDFVTASYLCELPLPEDNTDQNGNEIPSCQLQDSVIPEDDDFSFNLVFTSKNFGDISYYQQIIAEDVETLPADGAILENSPELFKGYVDYGVSKGYRTIQYVVFYKNAALQLYVTNHEVANQVIAKLGFPDRSYQQ